MGLPTFAPSGPALIYSASPVYYPGRFAPISGRYLVALYSGDYSRSPAVYRPAACYPHKALGAAIRRLASIIAERKGRHGYAALYIVTPDGDRLSLKEARALHLSGHGDRRSPYALSVSAMVRDKVAAELDRVQGKLSAARRRLELIAGQAQPSGQRGPASLAQLEQWARAALLDLDSA